MSSVRGRKDGVRSIRHRAAGSSTDVAGDWLAPAEVDALPSDPRDPRDPRARARRPVVERRHTSFLGWLRSLLFLPAGPAPMAHPDPQLAESGRRMARHQAGAAEIGAALYERLPSRPGGSAGPSPARRHFRAGEQRRREAAAVLGLLLVASAFSVAGPITGLGTEPDPTPIYVIAPGTDDPAFVRLSSLDPMIPAGTVALDPTYSAPPTPQPTKKPTPRPVVVRNFAALGDSLTAWPAYSPWPSRLDAQDTVLRLVKNAGVPGNTTSQMRARLAKDVYPYKPAVLFVLGGTNDLGYGVSESAIIANLRAIIVDAKAHKLTVILINVPPDSYPNMVPKIKSLNAAILHLGNSQRVNVIDIYSVLANKDGVFQSKYTSDGLHFSDLGCQTVANTIRARIRRLGL
jgi:lysophospholipase L1-like esterase